MRGIINSNLGLIRAPILTILIYSTLCPLPISHPLLQATKDNCPQLIRLLLAYNADPNINDHDKTSALSLSIKRGYFIITQLLLKHKDINVNKADNKGITPLMEAVSKFHNTFMVKQLIRAGADINARSLQGKTPLLIASLCGINDSLKILLAMGADINTKDSIGCASLENAICAGQETTTRLLLNRGGWFIKWNQMTPEKRCRPGVQKYAAIAFKRSRLIEEQLSYYLPKDLANLIRKFETNAPAISFV